MNDKNKNKLEAKKRRQKRVRARVFGTKKIPRLRVTKSLIHIYLQLIDDDTSKTLVSVHSKQVKEKVGRMEIAQKAGEMLGKKAVEKKITECVFDRGGSKYHGRVKAAAEGARKGGLKF